jgi:hypothetical protein
MGKISNYWILKRLEAKGNYKDEPIPAAELLVKKEFPDLSTDTEAEVDDLPIQHHLVTLLREQHQPEAGISLRCYISHQIVSTCKGLVEKFGTKYRFERTDLYPLVLTDFIDTRSDRSPDSRNYRSLGEEILAKFDPTHARLSTWTARLVNSHPELKKFLLEHGIYLISDWAILNDTTPSQLRQILLDYHTLTTTELEIATQLLTQYRVIYRDRRFQTGTKSRCVEPSPDQLDQIAALLESENSVSLSPAQILTQLHKLATQLRQYRIAARGGQSAYNSSLDDEDNPNVQRRADDYQLDNPSPDTDSAELEADFIKTYRQHFQQALDTAIAEIINQRTAQISRKKGGDSAPYLTGLNLFHCAGKSMSEIASAIGLEAQYQVSRLLTLKELRTDIRHRMLQILEPIVRSQAMDYVEPDRLQCLDRALATALAEQVDALIQQTELNIAQNCVAESFFAKRICQHLTNRRA